MESALSHLESFSLILFQICCFLLLLLFLLNFLFKSKLYAAAMTSEAEQNNARHSGGGQESEDSENETPNTARVSWVYTLKREELMAELSKFGLSQKGILPMLRKRLVSFFKEGPPKRTPIQSQAASSSPPAETEQPRFLSYRESTPKQKSSHRSVAEICETVRRWRLHFDGESDAVEFLEKLTDLQEHSDIAPSDLLPALYEVFKGNALAWYRNNRMLWATWRDFMGDFQQFYLPSDYQSFLEEQIYSRRQRPGESGRDYIVALQTLLRRHGNFSAERELRRLYDNLLPEYRQYIRRNDVSSIRDLVARVEEYEKLQTELQLPITAAPKPTPPVNPRRVPQTPPARVETPRSYTQAAAPTRPLRGDTSYPRVTIQGQTEANRPRTIPNSSTRYLGENNAPTESAEPRREPRQVNFTIPPPLINPGTICWRCGQTGHYRTACRAPPRLFCSRCGRNGIMTRDCPCHSPGN